jgi:hypothetical protein
LFFVDVIVMVIMKLLMMVMSLSATRHFRVSGGRPPFQHAHTSFGLCEMM